LPDLRSMGALQRHVWQACSASPTTAPDALADPMRSQTETRSAELPRLSTPHRGTACSRNLSLSASRNSGGVPGQPSPLPTRVRCVFADAQADMPLAEALGAICVQRFDDSRNSAIHTTYRISLRSSSLREPRYPLLRVVIVCLLPCGT
jgi:hypothetical protein